MRILTALLFCTTLASAADIAITVDASSGRKPISPWIYGKNNSLSDNPDEPVTSEAWKTYRDAGLRILRENGGNNCTKYNWRKKLGSHPDWYNNVYKHDWDYLARTLQDSLPGAQGFFGLQLLGKVAKEEGHNFSDWDYNQSAWWSGCAQNLAGGGTVNPDGSDSALAEGDPSTYLVDWPADSTTGILDHWFTSGGIGLDKSKFMYWNMDNEPEIWCATHDDALPVNITAEEFMQKYFSVAKSARKRFAEVRLTGFVACNEWQWYSWDNASIPVEENGIKRNLTWAEYFIKRIAEEQKLSGVKLLDVMDFHFYAQTASDPALTTQLHRIWFDTAWVFPKANGCKLLSGGWDEAIRKEFIMERCRRWLDTYMGAGHGVGFGVSEIGSIASDNANVVAVWYASHLGTFANEGVELFTPWEWHVGQWEVLHLFRRYCGSTRVAAESGLDSVVSAYASIGAGGDSISVVLVNRDRTSARTASVNVAGFSQHASTAEVFQLSSLPADTETFVSHEQNAIVKSSRPFSTTGFSVELPPLSVTAVVVTGKTAVVNKSVSVSPGVPILKVCGNRLVVRGGAADSKLTVALYSLSGCCVRRVTFPGGAAALVLLDGVPSGNYLAEVTGQKGIMRMNVALVR